MESPVSSAEAFEQLFSPSFLILYAILGVVGTGCASSTLTLLRAKLRFRRLGATLQESRDLVKVRGTKRWKERHPLLSIATNYWYQYEENGVFRIGTPVEPKVREGFEMRMEALQERLGSFWLLLSLSVAHDVRVAVQDEDDVAAAERYATLLEETLPHIENLHDFVLFTMEAGLVPACEAARRRIPVEYARALYPPAPTFAAPLTKEAYLRGEYAHHNLFDFEGVPTRA